MNTQGDVSTNNSIAEATAVAHTVTTTFSPGDTWEHEGLLYVRKHHDPERQKKETGREYMTSDERKHMKETIPYIEDGMKSDWLRDIMAYGPRPILLTYKASQNTFAQAPLFGCVLAKQTLHHRDTDEEMQRMFDCPKDRELRSMWLDRKDARPLFIKLWDAYPEVYEVLRDECDKKLVRLRYADQKLTIIIPHLNAEYVMDVHTIKNDY